MSSVVIAIGLAACGSDEDSLAQAFDAVAKVPHVASLAVHQDGALVREAYYGGTDRATLHDVRSVTKTVTSMLIGNALQTGCLTSVDQMLGDVLGDQAPSDPAHRVIRLRDLLTMASGVQWFENGAEGDYNAWASADNQVDFVLARPMVATPGTTFNYNSGALHLLSAAITHACGPTLDFAAGGLFVALGITSRTWETDNQGIANGAAGLQLATADLVQIGELIRGGGALNGTRLVPADYVAAATSAQVQTNDGVDETPAYGYGIWIGQPPSGPAFSAAEGFGGQFIFVVPERRAVIVATTDWQGLGAQANTDYNQLYTVMLEDVLPAME